jgi:hypothetical protein
MSTYKDAEDRTPDAGAACPCLVDVVADRLFMYPVGAFCRRPDGHVRVPAGVTLARVCTTPAYLACAGYRAGVTAAALADGADAR